MSLAIDTPARGSAPSGLTIRPFQPDDAEYAALVDLHNAVHPQQPTSVEALRHRAETRPPQIKHARYVALLDGALVGQASYGQALGMYHPQKFFVYTGVRPDLQGRGVGRALYEALTADLAAHSPISLRTEVREDEARTRRFLEERGFVEDSRSWESWLDVQAFDPAPFAGKVERVAAQGLRLTTLSELMVSDPDHRRKLYELDCEATLDEPMPEPFTPPGQEAFDRWVFDNPGLCPDGFFVAVDGERYAGLSSLFTSQGEPDTLSVGFTGVGRDYRRRGIALALKLLSVDYARRVGAKRIKTGNASTNRPMLSINEALGFQKQPAWINYLKLCDRE